MVKIEVDKFLDEWSIYKELLSSYTIFIKPSNKKTHLTKMFKTTLVWKYKEELLKQAKCTLIKIWSDDFFLFKKFKSTNETSKAFLLVTISINWQPFEKVIFLLDQFDGIDTSLVVILQVGIKVKKYLYIDKDLVAKIITIKYDTKLRKCYPSLFQYKATKTSFTTLI